MDVRNAAEVEPVVGHNGTVPVWWLVPPQQLRQETEGGFLELVSEFEVAPGGMVDPHRHPTHEFYYVTSGRAIMTIEGEERELGPGDLVRIPPDALHSIKPATDSEGVRCFCFAVGLPGTGRIDYSS